MVEKAPVVVAAAEVPRTSAGEVRRFQSVMVDSNLEAVQTAPVHPTPQEPSAVAALVPVPHDVRTGAGAVWAGEQVVGRWKTVAVALSYMTRCLLGELVHTSCCGVRPHLNLAPTWFGVGSLARCALLGS